jgi:3-oxoacyl-[acyl-carrier protein] reductase
VSGAAARRPAGCALVTGASRGIGAEIAAALARDGWPVGVNFRHDAGGATAVAERICASGGSALAVEGDVRDPAAVAGLFEKLENEHGPVLCLVNNAGLRADGMGALLSEEDWDSVLDTKLRAAFLVTRRALGPMLRARWGRIVSIASAAGVRGSAGQSNYSAANGGLIAYTRSLAVEVARRGVTVNAVAPGFVETTMTADVDRAIVDRIPARRPGMPGEIAACVRFLASEDAAYVTGVTLPVDGGLSA